MNTTSTPTVRLRGWGLLAARVTWVALIALSLTILVVSIPPGFQKAFAFVQDLGFTGLRLSADLVAAYLVAVQVVFALGCLVPAGVIFCRQSDNWMAMFVSLVGAMFGTNIPLVYTLHHWSQVKQIE